MEAGSRRVTRLEVPCSGRGYQRGGSATAGAVTRRQPGWRPRSAHAARPLRGLPTPRFAGDLRPSRPARPRPEARSTSSAGPATTAPPGPSPKRRRPIVARRVTSVARSTRAPSPPAMQHSASAQASPPSEMSCTVASPPARTAARSAASDSAWRREVHRRQAVGEAPAQLLELRAREVGRERARPARSRGPRLDEAGHRHALGIRQPPDHAHDRGGVDRALRALVVERHVAAHHRHAEREAGVAEALHRTGELPGDVRLLRVAEVQAVGEAERLGAHAGEVARALEHRLHRAGVGIAGHAPAVAVDRHGDRAAARRRPRAGAPRRRPPPAAARCASRRSSRTARRRSAWRPRSPSPSSGQQRALRIGVLVEPRRRVRDRSPGGLLGLQVVERAVVHQRRHGHVAHQLVAVEDRAAAACR